MRNLCVLGDCSSDVALPGACVEGRAAHLCTDDDGCLYLSRAPCHVACISARDSSVRPLTALLGCRKARRRAARTMLPAARALSITNPYILLSFDTSVHRLASSSVQCGRLCQSRESASMHAAWRGHLLVALRAAGLHSNKLRDVERPDRPPCCAGSCCGAGTWVRSCRPAQPCPAWRACPSWARCASRRPPARCCCSAPTAASWMRRARPRWPGGRCCPSCLPPSDNLLRTARPAAAPSCQARARAWQPMRQSSEGRWVYSIIMLPPRQLRNRIA